MKERRCPKCGSVIQIDPVKKKIKIVAAPRGLITHLTCKACKDFIKSGGTSQ